MPTSVTIQDETQYSVAPASAEILGLDSSVSDYQSFSGVRQAMPKSLGALDATDSFAVSRMVNVVDIQHREEM